ncbi:MAG: hypothetical protein JW768_02465 [Chitinispirillaceae bacterium]|nr:hypothetical protein [Chitinispirillaceae bacterium]
MDQKIQELTEQLFREGVQKGEERAQQIIDEARCSAAATIDEARTRSAAIIDEARREASELRHAAEGEIRLAGTHIVSLVKQQIADAVIAKVLDGPLSKTLSDPSVLRDLVLAVARNWNGGPLDVVIPASLEQELSPLLSAAIARELSGGLTVAFSRLFKGGLRIGPAGQEYKISMTDEDFAAFFKEFLRPRTVEILFKEKKR